MVLIVRDFRIIALFKFEGQILNDTPAPLPFCGTADDPILGVTDSLVSLKLGMCTIAKSMQTHASRLITNHKWYRSRTKMSANLHKYLQPRSSLGAY